MGQRLACMVQEPDSPAQPSPSPSSLSSSSVSFTFPSSPSAPARRSRCVEEFIKQSTHAAAKRATVIVFATPASGLDTFLRHASLHYSHSAPRADEAAAMAEAQIINGIKQIIAYAKQHCPPIVQPQIDSLSSLFACVDFSTRLSPSLAHNIKQTWENPIIQQTVKQWKEEIKEANAQIWHLELKRRVDYSSSVFPRAVGEPPVDFDAMELWCKHANEQNNTDYIHYISYTRAATLIRHSFSVFQRSIDLFEYNARAPGALRKFLPAFNRADALVFFVDLCIYDLEDTALHLNGLVQALDQFDSIINHAALSDRPVVVVLNNKDEFAKKLARGIHFPQEYFPDFPSILDPVTCIECVQSLFDSKNRHASRSLTSVAIDGGQLMGVSDAMATIKDAITREARRWEG